ncbi:AT-rich interactive domain-containing protein 5B [Platysternon megacephalum]|uniref:AT-rich interactive domain-containing protein 5B n=1 Tax=Platysternon megacephalum TaxID=55544 RepID=A0A4D9ENI3_9SAUR|nr:AT-rich interactive domain-containing protein 5B [Platysternon megacephalum]
MSKTEQAHWVYMHSKVRIAFYLICPRSFFSRKHYASNSVNTDSFTIFVLGERLEWYFLPKNDLQQVYLSSLRSRVPLQGFLRTRAEPPKPRTALLKVHSLML